MEMEVVRGRAAKVTQCNTKSAKAARSPSGQVMLQLAIVRRTMLRYLRACGSPNDHKTWFVHLTSMKVPSECLSEICEQSNSPASGRFPELKADTLCHTSFTALQHHPKAQVSP